MADTECNLVCSISGPNGKAVDVDLLRSCAAGRYWLSPSNDYSEYLGEYQFSEHSHVRVLLFRDNSAMIKRHTHNVAIVRHIVPWIKLNMNGSCFRGFAWDEKAMRSETGKTLELISEGRKDLLIDGMGESQAKIWFGQHGGILPPITYTVQERDLQGLLGSLTSVASMCDAVADSPNMQWAAKQLNGWINKFKDLRPDDPAEKS